MKKELIVLGILFVSIISSMAQVKNSVLVEDMTWVEAEKALKAYEVVRIETFSP